MYDGIREQKYNGIKNNYIKVKWKNINAEARKKPEEEKKLGYLGYSLILNVNELPDEV